MSLFASKIFYLGSSNLGQSSELANMFVTANYKMLILKIIWLSFNTQPSDHLKPQGLLPVIGFYPPYLITGQYFHKNTQLW